MKNIWTLTLTGLIACLTAAPAWADKPCEELKTEITTKLEASGVKNYSLNIVDSDKVGEAKVIGSCERGSKKITYVKQ